MKRYGSLYDSICSWDNLYEAARNARKGKRQRVEVQAFEYDLETNLLQLQQELETETYQPGPYRTFEVFDNKRRFISAAPYRDRVIHHAVCQVVVPIFERTYIHRSFAYRTGRGTHKAVEEVKKAVRRYPYVFQADIRKYFPSIDHEILKSLLRQKIKCPRTLRLLDTIIDSSNPQEEMMEYFPGDDLFTRLNRRRGLPIGNLTSQHFANIYLNSLDHFVTESLRCSAYIRYVDDFVLFANNREQASGWKREVECFLEQFRLRIHPIKSQIYSVSKGVSFLGYRIFPTHVRVAAQNVRRARRRFRDLQRTYKQGEISIKGINQRIRSWIGHVIHADSWRLREKIISPLVFCRGDGVGA